MQRSRWLRRFLPRILLPTVVSPSTRQTRNGGSPRALNVHRIAFESLEERCLLTVELISRADPSLISDSAGGSSHSLSSFGVGSAVSADGRYVAFVSDAPNIVPGLELEERDQIYRYDRLTEEVILVSVNSSGTGSANNTCSNPVISADGSIVAFASHAWNLHP